MSLAGLHVNAIVERGDFVLDVAFSVAPGEVLGVLGPNGAGKTTLLRALAGLTALSQGSIVVDEEILDEPAAARFVPPEQRPVGLLFQNYRLFPHLSVRDNVAFAPRCRGADRRAARMEADHWLLRLGLAELAGRKPGQLSGGQAQRVALARALAAHPALLLLDEPLAALDARTRQQVRGELSRHLRAFGGPTLIVTHDPLEAMVMTDRLLVLEGGRIVQEGTPAHVARHPATQYVARLVGLNLYPGVRRASGEVELAAGGTIFAGGTSVAGDPGRADGTSFASRSADQEAACQAEAELIGRVLVAIRPASVALHTRRPEHLSPRNVWAGQIAGLDLLADRVRVDVTGSPSALVDVTAHAVAELHLCEGTPVWLAVKATEVEVYADPSARDPSAAG